MKPNRNNTSTGANVVKYNWTDFTLKTNYVKNVNSNDTSQNNEGSKEQKKLTSRTSVATVINLRNRKYIIYGNCLELL